jgi:hypothetical protein
MSGPRDLQTLATSVPAFTRSGGSPLFEPNLHATEWVRILAEKVQEGELIRILGIVLIALGALMLVYQGISYHKRETVVKIGSLQVETEKEKTIPLPPLIGGITLASGVILLAAASRKGA